MTHCTYPDCNCPFDAPADPSWCARGLPKSLEKISERHLRQDLYLFGLKGLLADPATLDHIPAVKALREENERLNDRCMYWAGQFEAEQGKRIEAYDRHKSEIAALESQLAELRQGGEAVAEVVRNAAGQIHMLGSDGNCFDMSKFVGEKFYTRPQPAIPPGYVVEATHEMKTAALMRWHEVMERGEKIGWLDMFGEIYEAMLASAPAIQPQAAVPVVAKSAPQGFDKIIQENISQLYAAAPSVPVAEQDWLPIETAPRDGTEIIALDAYSYRNDQKRRMHFVLRSVFFNDEGGWEISEDGEILDEDALTHWLPRSALPASPVAFAAPADSKEGV